ncbi:MAG: electron transfer flavoprotein subunit alpha/FixB family protein [Euryarchaeota archaeon]|nr:electron transfer flavoprotein subunit alpha/FixB family protein [Euryarchaeota archaeon]
MTDGDPYASFLETYTREAAPQGPSPPDAPRPGEHRNLWVWIEHVDGEVYPASLENLGKARELADQLGARCAAVLFGHEVRKAAEGLGEFGADRVYVADAASLRDFGLGAYRDLLVGLAREQRPESLIFPATVMGRNLAAQVAAALGAGVVPNCVELAVDASERRLRHFQTSFEDRLLSEVVIPEQRPQVATVTPGSFRRPRAEKGRTASITDVPVPETLPPSKVRVGKREAPKERTLERADVVVVGGLGLASREGFRLTEELSSLLGGHVGATRAAVACGWCDPRLLITSSKHELRPRLYIACGVIGEYDHLKALEDSRQIVAITPDPTAPVAEQADLVGLGEPTAILHAMLESLRAARKDRFLLA